MSQQIQKQSQRAHTKEEVPAIELLDDAVEFGAEGRAKSERAAAFLLKSEAVLEDCPQAD